MSRAFNVPFARDGSVRFLASIVALMVYLAGLPLARALLLDAALGDWRRGVGGVMTPGPPPVATGETDDADVAPVLARLQATPGVASIELLPRAEVAKLVEPRLGAGQTTARLALPLVINVPIEPAHRPEVAALPAKPATAAPGAFLDNARPRIEQPFDLGFSSEIFTTWAGLGAPQDVVEILHIQGARHSLLARQFARRAPGLGLRGGLSGLIVAAATLALPGCAASAAITGPGLRLVAAITVLPRQWSVLVLVPIAAAVITCFTAFVVHGALALTL